MNHWFNPSSSDTFLFRIPVPFASVPDSKPLLGCSVPAPLSYTHCFLLPSRSIPPSSSRQVTRSHFLTQSAPPPGPRLSLLISPRSAGGIPYPFPPSRSFLLLRPLLRSPRHLLSSRIHLVPTLLPQLTVPGLPQIQPLFLSVSVPHSYHPEGSLGSPDLQAPPPLPSVTTPRNLAPEPRCCPSFILFPSSRFHCWHLLLPILLTQISSPP